MSISTGAKAAVDSPLRKELDSAWAAVRALTCTPSDNQTLMRGSNGFSLVEKAKSTPTPYSPIAGGGLWGDTIDSKLWVNPETGGPWLWRTNRMGPRNPDTGEYDEPSTTGWSHNSDTKKYRSAHYHYVLPPQISQYRLNDALSGGYRYNAIPWTPEEMLANTAEIGGQFYPVWGFEYFNAISNDQSSASPRVAAPLRWNYYGRPSAYCISRLPQGVTVDLLCRPPHHPHHSGATVVVEWAAMEWEGLNEGYRDDWQFGQDPQGWAGAQTQVQTLSQYSGPPYPYRQFIYPNTQLDNSHRRHWVAAGSNGVLLEY
jgi:hypothetical protein